MFRTPTEARIALRRCISTPSAPSIIEYGIPWNLRLCCSYLFEHRPNIVGDGSVVDEVPRVNIDPVRRNRCRVDAQVTTFKESERSQLLVLHFLLNPQAEIDHWRYLKHPPKVLPHIIKVQQSYQLQRKNCPKAVSANRTNTSFLA